MTELEEARWMAREFNKLLQEMPVGLDDICPEVAEYLEENPSAQEWLWK